MRPRSRAGVWRVRLIAMTASLLALAGTASAQKTIAVNIESTPPGAVVYLDSTEGSSLGKTPMEKVRLPAGSHTLIFVHEGYDEGRLPVDIRRWNHTYRFTLAALATVEVQAADPSATGAEVRIDGEPAGEVPVHTTVKPGRHLIQVGRKGYATFSRWVELRSGQVYTVPILLKPAAAETGSLLVTSDVPGVPVYIDGEPHGVTPTVVMALSAGAHHVELRPEASSGLPPFAQEVQVSAGQRETVQATLRQGAQPGRLRVLANIAGAEIYVDGTLVGGAPASVDSIAPGEHVVEARAAGYAPAEQRVDVAAGQQRVISLRLDTAEEGAGTVSVRSSVPGATVTIDGQPRGQTPLRLTDVAPGTHEIIVSAPGYAPVRRTCQVDGAGPCDIDVQLEAGEAALRVVADADGAELFVDGTDRGPVPWEGSLPEGPHLLEVRAAGYRAYAERIDLRSGGPTRVIEARLADDGTRSEAARAERDARARKRARSAVTHSAAPLPVNVAAVDLSTGWPWIAGADLSVGVLDMLDLGVGARTFGVLTEFEGRVKAGWRPIDQISFGGQLRFGGGVGPKRTRGGSQEKVNTAFFALEGIGSLHFSSLGALSVILGFEFHSDRYPPLGTGRENVGLVRLGGSLDIVLSARTNFFLQVVGVLNDKTRPVMGDVLWLGKRVGDSRIYGTLGVTYKFGEEAP